jgi:hypothetical protein
MRKVYAGKSILCHRGLRLVGSLLCFGFGVLPGQPSWGQAPMPPAASVREATALLPDPFYEALEGLSKKYSVAFVAEGRPFPQAKSGPVLPLNADPAPEEVDPSPSKDLSPEEAVQKVAGKYDYDAVRQGNVYLLTKRYTNPDDMPEVTPEECLLGLKRLGPATSPGNTEAIAVSNDQIMSAQVRGAQVVIERTKQRLTERPSDRNRGIMQDLVYSVMLHNLSHNFYFDAAMTRKAVTVLQWENNRTQEPVFRWQTIEKSPVFGYDALFGPQARLFFLPVSDCDRILVAPYGTPVPCQGYTMRYDLALPDPDPTDPAGLSQATKRFLDDNGRSSRAITLAEAIAALNKRATGRLVYKVDPAYAAKRVTLVGADNLSPEIVIQSLAAVYGQGVDHHRDNTVHLTNPPFFDMPHTPRAVYTLFHAYDKLVRPEIPAPIVRVMHARFVAGRTKTKNQEGTELLEYGTQGEFQRIAATLRNSAMQMFRYLAEPEVKAQPQQKLALSRLGERERILFAIAQSASVYADACKLTEIPLPPYITDLDDFRQNVTITEKVYRDNNGVLRVALALTYVYPQTGVAYGPVNFFDASMN